VSSYATVSRSLAAAGAFVVSLDSMVNVAFPAMAADFGLPADQLRWVLICYVLVYALVSLAGGALGDRVGHARVFAAGLAFSAAAFVVCGSAPTFGALLMGRALQGVGGGLIYGTTPALVTLGRPSAERGRALGLLNAAIGVGFALGPLAAGILVERLGWPAVFQLRAPLALGVLIWAVLWRPPGRPSPSPSRHGLSGVAGGTVLGIGALAFLANAGIFAIWLLVPFYLERRSFGGLASGALFMLTPLGTAVAAPLAGRLADRIGFRAPMIAGLALQAAGLLLLSRSGPGTPPALLALALLGAGFGLGIFQVPNMTAVMIRFGAAQQGAAGGFAFLARTLGTVAGVALLAQVFASRQAVAGFDAAFATALLMATGLVAVAAALAARVSR
jgi:MFS family permease